MGVFETSAKQKAKTMKEKRRLLLLIPMALTAVWLISGMFPGGLYAAMFTDRIVMEDRLRAKLSEVKLSNNCSTAVFAGGRVVKCRIAFDEQQNARMWVETYR